MRPITAYPASLALVGLLIVHPGEAATSGYVGLGMGQMGVDFSLFVQRVDTKWRYEDGVRTGRLDMIGVQWSEPLAPWLAGGLSLGYLEVTRADDTLLAGRELGGYFAGVQLVATVLERGPFRLTADVDYRYHDADDRTGDRRIEMQWHSAGAGLGLRTRIAPGLALNTRARYGLVDGEQLVSGEQSGTHTFEDERAHTYVFGLEAAVQGGTIAVDWREGQSEGIGLYFRRAF